MRKTLLLGWLLVALAANAQLWCAPGVVWTYRFQDWGGGSSVDYRTEYRYVGDTLYNGMLAHRVDRTSAGVANGQPGGGGTSPTYEAEADDVVWVWTTGEWGGESGWDTLYWYGAGIGDRWWPPGHPASCPPYGMLQVMDTSTQVIDGLPLATLHMDVLGEDGLPSGMPFVIRERLGSVPRAPFIFDCGLVIDYFDASFVCYSDDQITTPGDAACGLTMGVPVQAEMTAPISICPNPGTTSFTLTGLAGQRGRVRVLDAQGRTVPVGINTVGGREVYAEMLCPGSYLVEVITDRGERTVLRWVKE